AECAELLLAAGADPQAVDAQGRTALEIATTKGHARVAAVLAAVG
ncbi:MAG: ankyrin repeat domain-containing protein, partial [Armatimonadetes bacterium]|nr:ankyrin repeat domain-containing protein [Armatimonadota bacterium]